jgi:hypothetical protein
MLWSAAFQRRFGFFCFLPASRAQKTKAALKRRTPKYCGQEPALRFATQAEDA